MPRPRRHRDHPEPELNQLYWAIFRGNLSVARFMGSDNHDSEPNNFFIYPIADTETGYAEGPCTRDFWLARPRNGVIDQRYEYEVIIYLKKKFVKGKPFKADYRKLAKVRSLKRFEIRVLK